MKEIGMMLDLGAVGKGYAGDLVMQVLQENGITSALLDFGGNIQTIGAKPDGSLWRPGLRDPFSGGTLGVLEISNMAVVTSGGEINLTEGIVDAFTLDYYHSNMKVNVIKDE